MKRTRRDALIGSKKSMSIRLTRRVKDRQTPDIPYILDTTVIREHLSHGADLLAIDPPILGGLQNRRKEPL
jgi:hypothetical protein